ncbi:MAG: hypothetical protein AAF655_21405, partial [Bacteroidota bacterium]
MNTKTLLLVFLISIPPLTISAQEVDSLHVEEGMFSLKDFFSEDSLLTSRTDFYFQQLTDKQRVGQMMMNAAGRLGWPTPMINELVKGGELGGVLLLNGSREGFKKMATSFQSISVQEGHLPL